MPEICRFFGIVITMNFDDHVPPHFHVRYGDERASVLVIPSQFEVAPVAVAEAWALRVPVVATRVGGMSTFANGAAALEPAEPDRPATSASTGLLKRRLSRRLALRWTGWGACALLLGGWANGLLSFLFPRKTGAFGGVVTAATVDELRIGDRLAIGDGGLVLALTARAEPCQTIAHWFVERRIARISSKVNPADARWYASVVSDGPMATGDRVEVVRAS